MVTHMRYTLLMFVALLGVNIPPNRLPGRKPAKAASPAAAAAAPATAPCPNQNCQGKGTRRKELVYRCSNCNGVFYYCADCESFYPSDEKGNHEHTPPAV